MGFECNKAYINDDPGLTLTYFMARSNLFSQPFEWEKLKKCIFCYFVICYCYMDLHPNTCPINCGGQYQLGTLVKEC